MKTLKLLTIPALASLFLFSCEGESTEGGEEATTDTVEVVEMMEVTIDTGASVAMWKGTMLGLYSHEGTIGFTEGTVKMEGDQITGGSFVIDMTSITPTDENYGDDEGHTAADLVGHLSSDDFFLVDSFPTASFVITGAEENTVTGDLTIRGVTGEETVTDVAFSEEDGKKVATGKLTFNRQNYGVKFSMPVEDKVLSDDIMLDIKLVAAE